MGEDLGEDLGEVFGDFLIFRSSNHTLHNLK